MLFRWRCFLMIAELLPALPACFHVGNAFAFVSQLEQSLRLISAACCFFLFI